MKKRTVFYPALVLFFCSSHALAADTTLVQSPDGKVQFKLFQQRHQLAYSIGFDGQTVVEPSPLIMALDGFAVTKNAEVKKVERFKINETYEWRGVHSRAINQCNGAKIIVMNKQEYSIEVRVFNNGAAFRIIIPNSSSFPANKRGHVPSETTVFNIPSKSTIWYHDLQMHYESVHVKKQIDDVQQGEWVAPPATYKLPQGIYASITEAALVNYPGMAMQADGKNGLVLRLANEQPTSYPYKLRYSPEDTLRLRQPAIITGTITTPWRVVMIGKDLNSMVNNDMVWNLNPPPDKKLFPDGMNTDWIKPGRAVWKYLNGGGDGIPEVMKHFTDGAAALGFEHNILEGFWTRWTDEQIIDLVNYSKQKGVSIWFWKHSKSLRSPGSIDSFFSKCHRLGVAGAKIDFFDSEAKEVVDLYEAILKEAAKFHVMLDFHGANKPTGLERTYPNELTREAVKGMESSKLADRATHETTIPFTRLLAGPAEYTVVHFGERRKNTTWAHQVASAAILSAPLLTYAANPDTLLANPSVEIIKSIPAVWDETIVLPPSEIGELAVYARRKGNTWFLAVMNGVGARSIKVPLTFLKGNYKALIAKDDPANSASILIDEGSYSEKDAINLHLVSGGGFIARFSK